MSDTPEKEWYMEGRLDGLAAVRSNGGTRGAEWNAEKKQIKGIDKEDYIQGFNDSLDEHEEHVVSGIKQAGH